MTHIKRERLVLIYHLIKAYWLMMGVFLGRIFLCLGPKRDGVSVMGASSLGNHGR